MMYQASKQEDRFHCWPDMVGSLSLPQSISKVVLAVFVEAMLANLGKDFSGWFIITGLMVVCYEDSYG